MLYKQSLQFSGTALVYIIFLCNTAIRNIFILQCLIKPRTLYARNPRKMCPVAGLCNLKSHTIKRILRWLSF